MDYRRIGLVFVLIFIFFNSIYLVRFSIPGLANSSLDLDQDPALIDPSISISDIGVFENNYYIIHINNTFEISVYSLIGYTSELEVIFRTIVDSFLPPEIKYIDEDGIFLEVSNIVQSENWRTIENYNLDGDLVRSQPAITFEEIQFGSSIEYTSVSIEKSDNLVYILSSVASDRDYFLNYNFYKISIWDLRTGEVELLEDWLTTDLYDLQLIESAGRLYIVELLQDQENEGILRSYPVNGKARGNVESERAIFLPSEADDIVVVGPEEVYSFYVEFGVNLTLTLVELVSQQSDQFRQEGNLVVARGVELEVIDDFLVASLSMSVNYENLQYFFTMDLQGDSLEVQPFDIPQIQDGDYSSVSHILEDDNDIYFVARHVDSTSQIYKFESAYNSPLMSQSLHDGLELNLLAGIISLVYAVFEYRRSFKLEEAGDLQYPTESGDIGDNN